MLTGAPAAEAELADEVLSRGGAPMDAWAVAALLESDGLRDVDALERYGRRDLFELAESIYARCIERLRAGERPPPPAAPPAGFRPSRVLRELLRGVFFFVPLGIQVGALFALGYSHWASLDFSNRQASVVAVAVGLSFIVTAGFGQSLGYLGPFFDEPGKHMLTRRLVHRMLALAMLATVVFGGLCAAVAAALDAYPGRLLGVGFVYYALISALWLVMASLYMLRRYLAMTAATLAGVAGVAFAFELTSLGVYSAHWIGIAGSVAVALGLAELVLRQRAATTAGDLRLAILPRAGMLLQLARPYFAFGVLYFSFLLLDRAIGWSAGEHPLPVWFDTPYELGLDFALVAVVPAMAFLEYTVSEFSQRMMSVGERTPAARVAEHNRSFARFHGRQLLVVLAVLAVGAAGGYAAVTALGGAGWAGEVGAALESSVAQAVFLWGVGGYALLTIGLANAVFLFSAARPWLVVRAMAAAIMVNAALGIFLSRTYEYWYSVIGMTAGALVFALVTTVYALRVVRRADYYLFAAY